MAWNKTEKTPIPEVETKVISPGAPTVYMPGVQGMPYKDNWDINRAYEEGVRRVTWVFRAIDAIAGNQARLPVLFRKNNDPDGEVTKDANLHQVLNSTPNIGENSFVFRYRLSSQVLTSTRGAFIEVVRGNNGKVVSLNLLPPDTTAPIPHPRTFVEGYEVELGNGEKKILKPDQVIWVRRPHPLDPYLSLTPLEAAGLAIEVETMARLYNRNFLANDGRGGAMLILNGEINEDDRRELQSRHMGGPAKAGSFSVIAAEGGGTYLDLGTNPRDAAYIDMRRITKEEILAAFGVPESVIGNASGRTFSNAAEEARVFWMETMMPHLETIARPLDALDEKLYVGFDVGQVPILILAEQERNQYYMTEFERGVASANEYRESTGKKKVKSEMADALLVNPNLTAIGNTEKEMAPQQAAPGMAQAPLDVQSGEVPVMEFPDDVPTDGSAGTDLRDREDIPNFDQFEGYQAAGLPQDDILTKFGPEFDSKVVTETDRWEKLLGSTLDLYFERQARVVSEKANGKKAQASLAKGVLAVETIFNQEVWCKQLREDLSPVIQAAVLDSMELVGSQSQVEVDVSDPEVQAFIKAQVDHICNVNDGIAKELAIALLIANQLGDPAPDADDGDDGNPLVKAALLTAVLGALYVKVKKDRRDQLAQDESLTAYNAGLYFGAKQAGTPEKIWITRGDGAVREEHRTLHGQKKGLNEGFKVGEFALRFPKDPLAPPHLTVNCRCTLGFSQG